VVTVVMNLWNLKNAELIVKVSDTPCPIVSYSVCDYNGHNISEQIKYSHNACVLYLGGANV